MGKRYAAVLGILFIFTACFAGQTVWAGYGGIWKNPEQTVNIWLSEHDTRAMTAVFTTDLTSYESFLDSDFTDGFQASELGGNGAALSISFTGEDSATAVYTPSGGAPVSYALSKSFGGTYCGLLFSCGGIYSDPNGLGYRTSVASPFNTVQYRDGGGEDLVLAQDTVARTFGDKVFLIGRYGSDSVLVVDPVQTDAVPQIQYSVGIEDPNGVLDLPSPQSSSNPQDMVFLDESTAYMSFLGSSALLKLNPLTGERLKLIDLSMFNEGTDELPEAANMVRVGQYIYVSLGRLDRNNGWAPSEGMLAKIDTETDSVVDMDPVTEGVQGIQLQLRDPGSLSYLESTGEIFVVCTGDYNDEAFGSGVEVVDTATDASKNLMFRQEDVGYVVSDLDFCSPEKAYLVGTDNSGDWPWPYFVNEVNLTDGSVTQSRFHEVLYYIPEIAAGCRECGCTLFVIDNSDEDPGILAFNTKTNTVAGKAATPLPVQGMSVMDR